MNTTRVAVIAAVLMGLVSIAATAARPSQRASSAGPRFLLEQTVPKQFGDWRELPDQGVQVVNPQTQQLLDKLYSQLLARIYVNSKGQRIMLSMAYGEDQRGGLSAHKPEVCYPAQGFTLQSNAPGEVTTPFGRIPVRRLATSLGERKEPVTYWFTVADTLISSNFEKRMLEIRLGLTGQVPDGLLFRISSIDDDPAHAFQLQDAFVNDLMKAVGPQDRQRLSGLTLAAPG